MAMRYKTACIPLFLMVLLLAFENYEIWSNPSILPNNKGPAEKKRVARMETAPSVVTEKSVSSDEVRGVAEKNIFNPDRKEFSPPTPPSQEIAISTPRPQIFLYGVVISEDYQSASIINPGRTLHKGERETKTVKVGDSVGGYKVAKILSDRITMEGAGEAFDILLYDPQAPKRRSVITADSKPAPVTSAPVASAPPLTSPEKPSPAQAPAEKVSPPAPPKEPAERAKESIQERPVTPPAFQPATPYTRPSFTFRAPRPSRRPAYPTSTPLTQETMGN